MTVSLFDKEETAGICVLRGHVWAQGEMGICKPRRAASAETTPLAPPSDLPPPELWGQGSVIEASSLRRVTTAPADWCRHCRCTLPLCSTYQGSGDTGMGDPGHQEEFLSCPQPSSPEADREGHHTFYYDFFPKWTTKEISFTYRENVLLVKSLIPQCGET